MPRSGTFYLLILAAGCGGELADLSGRPLDPNAAPKQMFETSVQPIMLGTCNVCHQAQAAGPPFMAPMPDIYSTVKAWPGLIRSSPQGSSIYNKGTHEGPAFTPAQLIILAHWITAEARAGSGNPDGGARGMPMIPPFLPQPGANTVDLGPLGAGLSGAELSFDATISGAGLELAALKLTAPATTGVHVVHPLFAVYPMTGPAAPDPVDSFFDVDETIAMGQSDPLGPGTLILTSFRLGDRIGVAFQTLAATNSPGGMDGGTGGGGCRAVTDFTADAKPRLSSTCVTCHGGGNSGAQSALDMSRVDDASADGQAAACAQVRSKVLPGAPPQSRIFQVTAPGSADMHPFKFPDQTGFDAFQSMVSQWIVREQ